MRSCGEFCADSDWYLTLAGQFYNSSPSARDLGRTVHVGPSGLAISDNPTHFPAPGSAIASPTENLCQGNRVLLPRRLVKAPGLQKLLELRQYLWMVLRQKPNHTRIVEKFFEIAVDDHQIEHVLPV